MKSSIVATALIALTLAPSSHASCPGSVWVANSRHSTIVGLNGDPGKVRAKIWIHQRGDVATGSGVESPGICLQGIGCDSGRTRADASAPATCTPRDFGPGAMLYETTACGMPGYSIVADWAYARFDGCPDTRSDRVVVLMEDADGRYGLLSRSGEGGHFYLDAVPQLSAVPTMEIASVTTPLPLKGGEMSATVSWQPLNLHQATGAHAEMDEPSSPIVAGYRVYYWSGNAAPTSRERGAGWKLAGETAGFWRQEALAKFPAGNRPSRWIAISLLLDSGFETEFVGTPVRVTWGSEAANGLPLRAGDVN